jgi:hypothetical protein
MTLPLASGFATLLSMLIFVLIAAWYVAPWLRSLGRAQAITLLLWVQVFRYVALQIFSAAHFGFAASQSGQDQIAGGDVAGTVLALVAIAALRYGARSAAFLTWVFVVESAWDLTNATVVGIREQLLATASGLTWLIVNFYAPLLWVNLGLLVWQLYTRRSESLAMKPRALSESHAAMPAPKIAQRT